MTGAISVRRFSLPLIEPLRTAGGTIDHRTGIAIALRTDREIGVGEATPLSGWTEAFAATERTLTSHGDAGVEHWARWLPDGRPAARHAIQLAVADLGAQRAGLPLATYLRGDDVPSSIPVNATIGDGPLDATIDRATEAFQAGFDAVKFKVGSRPITETVERIDRLADLSDRGELRLDANRSWDLDASQTVLQAAADAGIRLVEEPLADPTPERLASIERDDVEIALDETVGRAGKDSIDSWYDAVDAIVLKPMAIGGLDRAIDLATAARAAGVDPIVSNTIDGVVARAGAVHLAAALRSERAAGLAMGGLFQRDLAADVVPVRDGRITVPTMPGIGTRGPWDRTATSGVEP